jgi:CCR4-NOT transcription complex subunit 1
MALFKFLNPFLQSATLHPPSRIMFKGALRILLVILKDFPEFLVEHYVGLCAAIPAHCIQLRNVVLCAFPRGIAIRQDVESLADLPPMPEFQQVPEVRTDYVRFLEDAQVKSAVDECMQNGQGMSYLLPELRSRIAISVTTADGTPGVTYNNTLLHSLTLYLGVNAVERQIARTGQVTFDASLPEVTLLTSLVASLDAEGEWSVVSLSLVRELTTIRSRRPIPLCQLGGEPATLPERTHVLLHALPPAPLLDMPGDELDSGTHRPCAPRTCPRSTTPSFRIDAYDDDIAARAQVWFLRVALG